MNSVQFSYSKTPTVFGVFHSLFEGCSVKNVLLTIYLTTNEWFLDDENAKYLVSKFDFKSVAGWTNFVL